MGEIVKNIIRNELYLLFFIVIEEVIRVLMKARDDLSFSLNQIIIMVVIVAVISVIQQLIKKKP
ncbi:MULTISPECIES: hypothetical protein [Clostridium]|uniref:Uncharacterized protein n=2 Tax=Clostridium TaxID=1485 RepID=A0A151APB9_9CLOT|nr:MULTISPECIES: hypothetical protein [Clostridium]KYH29469.1 hypothetical protein CLCOL_06990 [Clostridium colicanis DSM 13634]MBE6042780.1 hypothetical protein [Clostridium thermopalmarium]PRR70764.1 hypothetical protein CPAL_18490 [Clostridium thermopalmarium DSM 5974]PVZ22554.1 hypothetical protein LX19_01822 [Clostridium thermopalmarium DSM 5974]